MTIETESFISKSSEWYNLSNSPISVPSLEKQIRHLILGRYYNDALSLLLWKLPRCRTRWRLLPWRHHLSIFKSRCLIMHITCSVPRWTHHRFTLWVAVKWLADISAQKWGSLLRRRLSNDFYKIWQKH